MEAEQRYIRSQLKAGQKKGTIYWTGKSWTSVLRHANTYSEEEAQAIIRKRFHSGVRRHDAKNQPFFSARPDIWLPPPPAPPPPPKIAAKRGRPRRKKAALPKSGVLHSGMIMPIPVRLR